MLPREFKIGISLGLLLLLLLCLGSAIGGADERRADGPLNCYTCSGAADCARPQHPASECGEGGPRSCVAVFDESGAVALRGCGDALDSPPLRDYCRRHPDRCRLEPPARPHSCFRCKGDACEDPQTQQCPNATAPDAPDAPDTRCFMRFDRNTSDIVELGCASELEGDAGAVAELLKQKLLFLCDGSDCNDFDRIPSHECAECTSGSLAACVAPAASAGAAPTAVCGRVPYTQCYQRVTSDGLTERGCLVDLDGDAFYGCLVGADDKCRVCSSDDCNREIVPANRTQCHRCSSATDPGCHSALTAASVGVCPQFVADDECVAVYEGGVTRRGCRSELSCDAASDNCQICRGRACNSADLRRRADDFYGIFQQLPLNCSTCRGPDCLGGRVELRRCEGSPRQDCLSVFDEAGRVVQRGCELAVLAEQQAHCHAQPHLCFRCKSNGCNNMTDPLSFQQCLSCDASASRDCLFRPDAVATTRRCVAGCLAALYPRKGNPRVQDLVRACFEDLEAANRSACAPPANCVRCTQGDRCNDALLPAAPRLSCWHCSGPACSAPQRQPCLGYAPDDQCFILFDNATNRPARMGCRSEFTAHELLAQAKQLFVCDGDDCNSLANLPPAVSCLACDSAQDVNCAIRPKAVANSTLCATPPHTDCYTRVRSDGHTERGCVGDLPADAFLRCHDGRPSSLCSVCTESGCNKAVYPPRRQLCYRCSSADDPDCEAEPDDEQVCPLYHAHEECVTKLEGEVTLRGCGHELSCAGLDRTKCRTCSGYVCNIVNLAEQDVGAPGLFQQPPLSCLSCNGSAACQTPDAPTTRCSDEADPCVVVFAGDRVVGRGCRSAWERDCETGRRRCYYCKSNGCNDARREADFDSCLFCDSRRRPDCVFRPNATRRTRRCHKGCLTALYPRSPDPKPALELLRSCLDDLEAGDRQRCLAGDEPGCVACRGDRCNRHSLGERKSCYHCHDEQCRDPQVQRCRAVAAAEPDQCFARWDERGDLVEMGCRSQYDPPDLQILLDAKRLWLCDEDNCNSRERLPTPQNCSLCSSRTDPRCARAPHQLDSATECARLPLTQCYSRVLRGGHTERGCLSDLAAADLRECLGNATATKCSICTGDRCNRQLFPEGRLSCHECSSASDPACEAAPDSGQVCLLHAPGQRCVALLTAAGHTQRGCSAQLSCDPSRPPSECATCAADNCNRANVKRRRDGRPGQWQPLPLACLGCNGTAECAAAAQPPHNCSASDYCMTVFDEAGQVRRRGCSGPVEQELGAHCDLNAERCHNCNSNLCNAANSSAEYVECLYCDSASDANCVANVTAVAGRRRCRGHCMTVLRPRDGGSGAFATVRSCLDDKEAADRQRCLEGGGADDCKACSDSACNAHPLPPSPLSCWRCSDANCEEAHVATCRFFREGDRCFALFDAFNDLAQLGCESDLSADFVASNGRRLFLCSDGANCNGFAQLPAPKVCVACSSNDDPDCAAHPDRVPDVRRCSTLPHTQCYTSIRDDGSTERGCVSDLLFNETLACLSGSARNCTTCHTDRCNLEVFPAERRRCHRCNSKEDAACATAPQAAAVCPVYAAAQFCAVKLVNGHTYRGCSSDFQCDESDQQFCRMCRGADNCNTDDLASSAVGRPGRWQPLPLSCYTCRGAADCQAPRPHQLARCEGENVEQICGTVFAANGSVVQRACSDQLYAGDLWPQCRARPDLCHFCKSNACNSAAALADYGACLFCDGADPSGGRECVFTPERVARNRSCHKGCMTSLYARSAGPNPAYELARSCLDDLDPAERAACANGSLPLCRACHDAAKCNTALVPETRLGCYYCSAAGCDYRMSLLCQSFRERDQCFVLFAGGARVQRMGCASDLDASFLEAHRRRLLLCDGLNCNSVSKLPQPNACKRCSSADDARCATDPALVPSAQCGDLPSTQCYTRLDNDGVTHRGCLSDLDDDAYAACEAGGPAAKCEVCDSADCNAQIFPRERRRCHRCDSAAEPGCAASPPSFGSSAVCPLYAANDSCVTKIEGERLLRGCLSDFGCGFSGRDTCRVCAGADNCNTVDLLSGYVGEPGRWQDLPLSCLVCDGGAQCANGSAGALRRCAGNNLQTCLTVFGADGAVVARGCSDAVLAAHEPYCDRQPDKCVACKSNGCNEARRLADLVDCYFCDSATNSSCTTDFEDEDEDEERAGAGAHRTRKCLGGCMAALYPRSSSVPTAYELTRSCLDDLERKDRERCAAGLSNSCAACRGPLCNTMDPAAPRQECFHCADGDCEDAESRKCRAHQPGDQCYALFDEQSSLVALGCRSEFEGSALLPLVRQKRLILCRGHNCNSPEALPTAKTCSVCHSQTDARCATNPNLVARFERCPALPYTHCYTRIDNDGHTERGCLAALPGDAFVECLTGGDKLCQPCLGDRCNEIDVFPPNRRRCQQCSSESDARCAADPDSDAVCPLYSARDVCVVNVRNGTTTRGCSSSVGCDNKDDRRTCRLCDTDGCNTINLAEPSAQGEPGRWQQLPLTCHVCDGEQQCAAADKGAYRKCAPGPFQSCVTVFNVSGAVMQRGCSDAVEAANRAFCAAHPQRCLRCHSSGCNEAVRPDEYVECLSCDSEEDADCLLRPEAVTTTRLCRHHCLTGLYARERDEHNPALALSRSCLDDLDLDDREACAAGRLPHCQSCSGAKCNTALMPARRLSCNRCADDSCQEPRPQPCRAHRANDSCYIRFDERNSVVAMGCRSDFSNREAELLLRRKRLLLCAGDNCNRLEGLPADQSCWLCSSRTNPLCATSPRNVTSSTYCSDTPYPQCYTRVLGDGSTERGCLASLYDDEFADCLSGASPTCAVCGRNACNRDLFPAGRLACFACDSLTDPDCEARPAHLAVCPKYDPADRCVTALRLNVTRRGCASALDCDNSDLRHCARCSGSGCNTVNLARGRDDHFGMWQDLPLTCFSCNGSACDSALSTTAVRCALNDEQDCMTVFDAAGKVVRRGCSDAVRAEYGRYCGENGDSCFGCKSNRCNSARARSQFGDCVYCDSHREPDCVWRPRSGTHRTRRCQGGCMTALFPSDQSAAPAYDLIRTCLNDKEPREQRSCLEGEDAHCAACNGPNCNVAALPAGRLACFACDGDDCEEPASRPCPLHKDDDRCFIEFDETGSVAAMGCASSLRQPLLDIVQTRRVFVCNGTDCNSPDAIAPQRRCAVCDSRQDALCATRPHELTSFQTCRRLPYTDCYSRLTSNGTTERGCVSDLDDDLFADCVLGSSGACATCRHDGCNRQVFPADRLRCFACSSADDPNCESLPESSAVCPLVAASEFCVTALRGNVTVRGCRSSVDCDASDGRSCRSCNRTKCNGIDLANHEDDGLHGVWQPLPLRCHACEGEQCLNSLGPLVTCPARNARQDCMTVFAPSGDVRRRGCADDVEDYEDLYCRQNPDFCHKCKSNECNVAWSVAEFVRCAFCDSARQPLCVTDPENASLASRSCFRECMVALKGARTIRSCLDDREPFAQHECHDDDEDRLCATCTAPKCNTFVFPANRQRCLVCSDAACSSSRSQYCPNFAEKDFCFVKYEGERVELLGCGSSYNSSDLDEWAEQKKLFRCTGSDCNDPSKVPSGIECLSCDSRQTPHCAQNPRLVRATEKCGQRSEPCLTRVDKQGHTLRSCFGRLAEDEKSCLSDGSCAVCKEDRCNDQVFPIHRRRCHICSSASDKECAKRPAHLQICPLYAVNDSCVTKSSNQTVERGCGSQLSCDPADARHCRVCHDHGCNTVELPSAASGAAGGLSLTLLLALVTVLLSDRI